MPTWDLRLALLSGLALTLAGCGDVTDPAPETVAPSLSGSAARNGRISFVSDRSGNYQIYTMNPDGTGLTNVSNYDGFDFQPAWSPDGLKLAFSRIEATGNQNLWVMNADGGDKHQVTSLTFAGDPVWSPDGKRLAFDNFNGTDFDVMVVAVDGTGLGILAGGPGLQGFPHWEPNGDRVVFNSQGDNPPEDFSHFDLFLVNSDGRGMTRLTRTEEEEIIPKWSPDGTKILFSLFAPSFSKELGVFVIGPDGRRMRRLFKPLHENEDVFASWSPDGRRLLITLQPYTPGIDNDVATSNLGGGDLVNLTASYLGFDGTPDWGRATARTSLPLPGAPAVSGISSAAATPSRMWSTAQGPGALAHGPRGALSVDGRLRAMRKKPD